MKITLVGMGGGTFDSVTMQGAEALHEATLIIGAKRLLENLPDFCTQNRIAMYKIGEILSVFETTKEQNYIQETTQDSIQDQDIVDTAVERTRNV